MQESSARQKELAEKRRFWHEQIETWKNSDLKPTVYCQRHQLKIHSFWYWKKKFSARQLAGVSFVRVFPPQLLHSPEGPLTGPLRLLLGEFKIEVQPGFDPQTLKQLVRALGQL